VARSAPPQPPPETPPDAGPPEPGEKYLTLVEHLQELRRRLIVSSLAVVVGLAVSAVFADDAIEVLKEPAEDRVAEFQLQFIEPFEAFAAYFRVALLGGLILAMPVIVWQALAFVSPGLRPNERRWLFGTVAGATALFLGGVLFAYFVALPPALDFLLEFGGGDLAQANIRIGAYIDFVTRLLFWTGVSFQTPIVVMYLARFRIISAGQLLRWWRYAVVAIAVVAAVITPTVDPVTMTLVAAPMLVLYFVGVALAALFQPR
jgi:sec-independent protein translocase protein TatC